ncbi:MAG: hypothetical protein UCI88_06345 [Megasphaera massiliensis]|uniref:hypothetical protein n=1 Tax=Megasphaera TaxID=906 RepID=UPI000806FBC0|nr:MULTISPECIES: hypothetical protein [Megasphaera]MCQ5210017.1 hypothetical protein [Megasphaera massiliensis]MEE0658704.1 hypothetical protein [Megasphaera massiliensis]OBZ32161.1 hypothetical protein A0U42_02420 [Megasphaera sp. DISK 18]
MKKTCLADIWGDTVDLYDLGKGIVIGIVISISCYLGAHEIIITQAPEIAPKLVSAYSLLFGIGGCVISAVVSAKLFKPKRTLNEEEFSEKDRDRVLNELNVDISKEQEELKYADAKVLQEMKDLKLYELFYGHDKNKSSEALKGDET